MVGGSWVRLMLSQWEIILSALTGFGSASCHCALAKHQLLPYTNSSKEKYFIFLLKETFCAILQRVSTIIWKININCYKFEINTDPGNFCAFGNWFFVTVKRHLKKLLSEWGLEESGQLLTISWNIEELFQLGIFN